MENNFFINNSEHDAGNNGVTEDTSNFFQTQNYSVSLNKDLQTVPLHKVNGLDSVLIEETAYKEVKDETFRLEYRINYLENDLKLIAKQIMAAKDINDFQKIDILTIKKHQEELELNELYKKYNKQGLSAKLSGGITGLVISKPKQDKSFFDNVLNFISDEILAKISKRFSAGRSIKVALSKLDNINKNVDELVSMDIPYGEGPLKYERLTNYLSRANVIQYQISKTISQQ